MQPVTLKEAILKEYTLSEAEFESFVLRKTLFFRVRVVRPIIRFFFPEYLFNERRLVEKIGQTTTLREVQEEVDFYQHKYVVNFTMKDALRFRISGLKLMSLANHAFQQVHNSSQQQD